MQKRPCKTTPPKTIFKSEGGMEEITQKDQRLRADTPQAEQKKIIIQNIWPEEIKIFYFCTSYLFVSPATNNLTPLFLRNRHPFQ